MAHYAAAEGKIRTWFEEVYREIAAMPEFAELERGAPPPRGGISEGGLAGTEPRAPVPVEQVHGGYFASDKDGPKDSKEGKSTKADDDAYRLIMQAKEELLSPDVPLRFIFSHSALREGWDNPNVFQICTLRQGESEIRKRQEIGRGLRLARIENGQRCDDPQVNRLTVIASESFADFAGKLQKEMLDECGVSFAGRIADKRDRFKRTLNRRVYLDPEFEKLWKRISDKTRYRVEFATPEIVASAAKLFREMTGVSQPQISVTRAAVTFTTAGVEESPRAARTVPLAAYRPAMPDVIGYLQRETELTRSTVAEILAASGRIEDALKNPQEFMEQAASAIQQAKRESMVDGIKYERIAGQSYEMRLFENDEIEGYLSRMVQVKKSIYDVVEYDSELEKEVAQALDARCEPGGDIELFVKLPRWFVVDTPLGDYNPDWALVKKGSPKLYLVRETKSSTDPSKLRPDERLKVRCGMAHFDGCLRVPYKLVASVEDLD